MPSPLPGPRTTRQQKPELVADDGVGVGVLLDTESVLEATPKVTVTDTFTNLNDWVTVYGSPVASGGMLVGTGVVRHKTQALTDSHRASAVIGSAHFGRTRLTICADESFSSYYAVEVEQNLLIDNVNFIKGVPGASIEAAPGLLGILNSILALLFGLLSIFSKNVTPAATSTGTILVDGDELAIWYDEPNTTVRIYKNDVAILNVPVPRGEIPHGEGNRWHGAAVGIEYNILGVLMLGSLMASYECVDV